ncbi:hypothetical protein SI65_02952 [Aspergillus cristatus]|uniref:RNA polymerase II holoenzyme cyclin-like subunit n=1 Tax=Aspergillus cristatus TaxID=573508 RepID=A0A1E3BNZ4_ASPCR|nr:hypothetical protein SI65_02952 [Aspergillus cristatus]
MIEDDIYRTSSQFRIWSFTEDSLKQLRATTNTIASERVRAALRRAREARQSAAPSAAGTPTANQSGSEADGKGPGERIIECLTPEEEQELVRYYCEKTVELGETYKPPMPTIVRATAIQYLRRFYLTNSPMTYHPKSIMACALFLATKTDNYYMSLRQFAAGIPGDTTQEDVIAPEFLIMQSLRFTFDVRHPFRGLEGGIMELQAISQGLGQPSPLQPQQTPEDLRRGLSSIPPAPNASSSQSLNDRLARAHHTTREILKSAAQMTDAYFLYTPSQIWLSAFFLADKPLAEFYLDTKIGGPLSSLRTKLLTTLTNCSNLLSAYKPLSTDPEQMKTLRRIAKKLYHCQNPEKANIAGQKRIPAAAMSSGAATAAGTPVAGGGSGESGAESEMERLAKKRKLEGGGSSGTKADDMFGGELVTQRNKQQGPTSHPEAG